MAYPLFISMLYLRKGLNALPSAELSSPLPQSALPAQEGESPGSSLLLPVLGWEVPVAGGDGVPAEARTLPWKCRY